MCRCSRTHRGLQLWSIARRLHSFDSTDLLVEVRTFVYNEVVKIGKCVRVRDVVPIMRPSDTHGTSDPDGCQGWLSTPGEVADLSRVSDAVLGLPTQFQYGHWPAFTIQNLLANTEANNECLNS